MSGALAPSAISATVQRMLDAGQLPQDDAASAPPTPAAPAAAAAGPQRHSAFWPMLADGAGNLADLVTTQQVLAQPRGREGNPLMSSTPAINALQKAAGTLGEEYLIHKLNDTGHSTAAKVFGLLLGGIGASAAIHNVGVYRSLR